MTREAEPATMRRPALPHTARANFPLTSVTSPQAWGHFSFSGMKWERAHEREKSTVTYRFSVSVVVTSRAFSHLFRKTGFASIPQLCKRHFDFIVCHLCCSTVTQTEKVGCSPYICAWEATLQCLVECIIYIFKSGSTLKWLVIMFFFLHTCRFSSIWTAGFSTFNIVCVCICADAVRRLYPGASDSEMREVVTTWLTGSRDNGKREKGSKKG